MSPKTATDEANNAGKKSKEEEADGDEEANDDKNDNGAKGKNTRKARRNLQKSPPVQLALIRIVLPAPETTNMKQSNEGSSTPVISLLPPKPDDGEGDDHGTFVPRVQVIDTLNCRVGKNGSGRFHNTLPFSLQAIARPSSSNQGSSGMNRLSIFVVIARPTSLHVYFEPCGKASFLSMTEEAVTKESSAKKTSHRDNLQYPPISFTINQRDPLTAVIISSNKTDVACGHKSGSVYVMNNMLTIVEEYHLAMESHQRHFGDAATSSSNKTSSKLGKPEHPGKRVIKSKMHWHAHPVSSLTYDASVSTMVDPLLYSGGDESVLVTWQLSRNTNRPAHVLPRLALAGIVSIATCSGGGVTVDDNTPNGILVYSEDNSLQLIESHNKTRLWKIQGLAAKEKNDSSNAWTYMETDRKSLPADASTTATPTGQQLILMGLPEAPGYMHWYDPQLQRVTASLEVAPFNRISRTEQDESPMPEPAIVNHALSANGNDLITVDEVLTENASVGAHLEPRSKRDDDYGIITTIRFWSWDNTTMSDVAIGASSSATPPYSQVASMTYPHGPKNRISALAMSPDGSHACTVSSSEGSFRVWHKVGVVLSRAHIKVEDDDGDDKKKKHLAEASGPATTMTWTCLYKITSPSGFSNMPTNRDALAFSDDSSVLSIAYGNFITLWDTQETRLLTTVRHLGGDGVSDVAIDSLQFVNSEFCQDMLLTTSRGGVTLQSPFGVASARSLPQWNWGVPRHKSKRMIVTSACLMETHDCVAVALYHTDRDESEIAFIDMGTGELGIKTDESDDHPTTNFIEGISGRIVSIRSAGKRLTVSRWGSSDKKRSTKNPVRLFALTHNGELLCIAEGDRSGDGKTKHFHRDENNHMQLLSDDSGPRLNIPPQKFASDEDQRIKRRRLLVNVQDDYEETYSMPATPKFAVDNFGIPTAGDDRAATTPAPTSDLPALNGSFVRAFVGRNLSRHSN